MSSRFDTGGVIRQPPRSSRLTGAVAFGGVALASVLVGLALGNVVSVPVFERTFLAAAPSLQPESAEPRLPGAAVQSDGRGTGSDAVSGIGSDNSVGVGNGSVAPIVMRPEPQLVPLPASFLSSVPSKSAAVLPPWADAMQEGDTFVGDVDLFETLVRDNRRLDAEVVSLEAETASLQEELLTLELRLFAAGLPVGEESGVPATGDRAFVETFAGRAAETGALAAGDADGWREERTLGEGERLESALYEGEPYEDEVYESASYEEAPLYDGALYERAAHGDSFYENAPLYEDVPLYEEDYAGEDFQAAQRYEDALYTDERYDGVRYVDGSYESVPLSGYSGDLVGADPVGVANGLEGQGVSEAAQGAPQQRLVIADVLPGSTAEGAGLQPGDILLEIDGREVGGIDDVVSGGGGLEGELHELVIVRDGARFPVLYSSSPVALTLSLDWVDPNFVVY